VPAVALKTAVDSKVEAAEVMASSLAVIATGTVPVSIIVTGSLYVGVESSVPAPGIGKALIGHLLYVQAGVVVVHAPFVHVVEAHVYDASPVI
jgi:hypothetical protein